jgi:hypothetical protein
LSHLLKSYPVNSIVSMDAPPPSHDPGQLGARGVRLCSPSIGITGAVAVMPMSGSTALSSARLDQLQHLPSLPALNNHLLEVSHGNH